MCVTDAEVASQNNHHNKDAYIGKNVCFGKDSAFSFLSNDAVAGYVCIERLALVLKDWPWH